MPTVCGIDPGVSGALAFYDTETREPVALYDMPLASWVGGRNIPDAAAIAQILEAHAPQHVFVERVWVQPREGSVGAFTFGASYGIIIGVIAALKIPYSELLPQQWQRAVMMHGKASDKNASRTRFAQLWPAAAASVGRVKDHGRADAALIAHAGAMLTLQASEAVQGASAAPRPRRPVSGDAPSPGQGGPGTPPEAPPGRTTSPRG